MKSLENILEALGMERTDAYCVNPFQAELYVIAVQYIHEFPKSKPSFECCSEYTYDEVNQILNN